MKIETYPQCLLSFYAFECIEYLINDPNKGKDFANNLIKLTNIQIEGFSFESNGKFILDLIKKSLYSPNEGTILINDIPIEEYEKDSYIKQISAVFQDYKLFAYSFL